jgi:hypothetical protein
MIREDLLKQMRSPRQNQPFGYFFLRTVTKDSKAQAQSTYFY